MEEERDAADRIKQKVPILVVLGNPPYNGYAGIPVEEEKGLVEPYRHTKTAPKPQGQGLNDLYIRFFRLAERCITERHAQHGIVCYIPACANALPRSSTRSGSITSMATSTRLAR
jgi:predicted helicase